MVTFFYGDEPQSLTNYNFKVYTSEVDMEEVEVPKDPKELAVVLARIAIKRIEDYEKWSTPELEETFEV